MQRAGSRSLNSLCAGKLYISRLHSTKAANSSLQKQEQHFSLTITRACAFVPILRTRGAERASGLCLSRASMCKGLATETRTPCAMASCTSAGSTAPKLLTPACEANSSFSVPLLRAWSNPEGFCHSRPSVCKGLVAGA